MDNYFIHFDSSRLVLSDIHLQHPVLSQKPITFGGTNAAIQNTQQPTDAREPYATESTADSA